MKQPSSHVCCIHIEGNRRRDGGKGRSCGSGNQGYEKCEGATENVRYIAPWFHVASPTHFVSERSSLCNTIGLSLPTLKRRAKYSRQPRANSKHRFRITPVQ